MHRRDPISWTLATAYMVKLGLEQRRSASARASERVRGVDLALSTFTMAFLVVAVLLSGIQQLLLCLLSYIPGIAFYRKARREQEGASACVHLDDTTRKIG